MALPAVEISYPYIVRRPDVCGGQPVVDGTRITVATLAWYHQHGLDFDELLVNYPGLTPQQLHAALLYYLDHRDEIDVALSEDDEPPAGALVVGS
jgi:uncharacterized protein (DUF433 family)